jgi:hypothetical protein
MTSSQGTALWINHKAQNVTLFRPTEREKGQLPMRAFVNREFCLFPRSCVFPKRFP